MTTKPATLDWARFAACHICDAKAGLPCVNMSDPAGDIVRQHPERLLAVERDGAGVMLLARREHVTSSRPGTTHGAHAHHAVVAGVTVCGAALVAEDTWSPLPRLSNRERCQRPACKRLWREEEW